jgi:hypothetical protein
MAADFRLEFTKGAIDRLLKQESQADLRRRGEAILSAVGDEFYRMDAQVGAHRFRVAIITRDARAGAHEAKHHSLLHAFDAGRA